MTIEKEQEIVEDFSLEKMQERYEEIYQNLFTDTVKSL